TEAGERPDFLDHLDLLRTGTGEDDVELVLLLFGRRGVAAATAATAGRSNCDGRSRGHAELLFEVLEQFAQLKNAHVANCFEDFFLGGHCGHSLSFSASGAAAGSEDSS